MHNDFRFHFHTVNIKLLFNINDSNKFKVISLLRISPFLTKECVLLENIKTFSAAPETFDSQQITALKMTVMDCERISILKTCSIMRMEV